MLEQLLAIGLTTNEAKVYEVLVQESPCKAGLLIIKLDIHRNAVYEALDSLVRKSFATKIRVRGVWQFQITEPDSLITALRRKEQLTNEVIGEIKALRKQTSQQITVYEGVDSYRSYWLGTLDRFPDGTIDYFVGHLSLDEFKKFMGPSYEGYMAARAKKRFVYKSVIFRVSDDERELVRANPDITEYRVWDKKVPSIGNYNIIGDTIMLQTFGHTPRVIEIRDKDLVAVFRGYFDAMWDEGKPIKV